MYNFEGAYTMYSHRKEAGWASHGACVGADTQLEQPDTLTEGVHCTSLAAGVTLDRHSLASYQLVVR